MRSWFRSLKVLTAMMLIFAMSAVFLLPPRMHIVLCLGSDGHLDIVEKACLSDCLPPHSHQGNTLYGENHNLNCLDMLLGCTSCEQLASPEENHSFFKIKAKKDFPRVTGLPITELLAIPDYQKPLTLNFKPIIPELHHLALLETTVIIV